MRADRLLSLLILLQTRGSQTAEQLAGELEVSVRTIYRDLQALSAAGVPVYAERGPGGGCSLLEGYRTNLTGLTPQEARALFMLSIPAPLDQLGVTQELKAALLKLSAALPASGRSEEESSRQRIHLDSSWWFQAEEAIPCLSTIQQALWQDRKLRLAYRADFGTQVQQIVAPYGLVAKASIWYLVYAHPAGDVRALQVARVVEAEILDQAFERPADFNLAEFWNSWCAEFEDSRIRYWVKARVAPGLVERLPNYFGDGIHELIAQARPADGDGWITLTLPFESLNAARTRILGFGRAIEVLEPEALRKSVIDFAAQITDFYRTDRK
jgi:predicted DNA-binding transcriptional regulator YafY